MTIPISFMPSYGRAGKILFQILLLPHFPDPETGVVWGEKSIKIVVLSPFIQATK